MSGVSPAQMHPSHLGRFAPSVSPGVLLALANHPRLAMRFRALLPAALAAGDVPEPENAAEKLALDAAERIGAIGLMMGAAWHARSIGRCIGSELVNALEAGIGRDARLFGLRNAALAVASPETVTAQALVERVKVDGLRCLVRWRDGLSEPLRGLATLKLPREALPEGAPETADPIIAEVLKRVADAL